MKAVRPVSRQMGPFPPNEIGRIAQSVRKGGKMKEGKDWKIVLDMICTSCVSFLDEAHAEAAWAIGDQMYDL